MPPDIVYELPPVAMFLSILGCTGQIALGLHLLFMWRPFRRFGGKLTELSPVIMTLCGTLFVLSVTFLANSIWQNEDRARETISVEARSLQVIKTYMESMTGPSRDSFARIIAGYGESVAREWPQMHTGAIQPESEQSLKDIYAAVLHGFAEGDLNRLLQQRMSTALDQLSVARQQRLSMAQDVVSGGQWFLVTMLGLLLLAMVTLGHSRDSTPRAVALSAITVAITLALFVIVTHDRPFVGYQALSPQAIVAASGAAH